jgi:hypothetical protein
LSRAKVGRTVHSPRFSIETVGASPSFARNAGRHRVPAAVSSGTALVLACTAEESSHPKSGSPETTRQSLDTATKSKVLSRPGRVTRVNTCGTAGGTKAGVAGGGAAGAAATGGILAAMTVV